MGKKSVGNPLIHSDFGYTKVIKGGSRGLRIFLQP